MDDRRFVSEVARVLCKTGTLVIFTPHGKGVTYKPEDTYHVREHNQEEFWDILSPYFSSIRWFGRRQGARLKAAERSMDSVRRFDPAAFAISFRVRFAIGPVVWSVGFKVDPR